MNNFGTRQEQDAFIEAFITTIGGVDEDAVGCWVRGEDVDLHLKDIEILEEAMAFWEYARELFYKTDLTINYYCLLQTSRIQQ